MKKLKYLMLSLVFTSLFIQAIAQEFTPSFGFRSGKYSAFTARIKYTDDIALEAMLGWKNHGTIFTGMVQKFSILHTPWADGFFWNYGMGAHFGFSNAQNENDYYGMHFWDETMYKTAFVAGIDGLIGIEYMFPKIPFSVGIDVKPIIELYDIVHLNVSIFEIGINFRYHLGGTFYKL